jgi:hypothetical protein
MSHARLESVLEQRVKSQVNVQRLHHHDQSVDDIAQHHKSMCPPGRAQHAFLFACKPTSSFPLLHVAVSRAQAFARRSQSAVSRAQAHAGGVGWREVQSAGFPP